MNCEKFLLSETKSKYPFNNFLTTVFLRISIRIVSDMHLDVCRQDSELLLSSVATLKQSVTRNKKHTFIWKIKKAIKCGVS